MVDDAETAFPASETTPGQSASRSAYARFLEQRDSCGWWPEWQTLRSEGWDWRRAALIAWEATPVNGRWPATQTDLATSVLGLKSDRVIRKWKHDIPEIEERIAKLLVEPLMAHRADVIKALVDVARTADPRAHPDRKLFLEMTQLYQPSGRSEVEILVADDARERLARLLGAEDAGGAEGAGDQPAEQ